MFQIKKNTVNTYSGKQVPKMPAKNCQLINPSSKCYIPSNSDKLGQKNQNNSHLAAVKQLTNQDLNEIIAQFRSKYSAQEN